MFDIKDQHISSVKGQRENIFSSVGHTVSVVTTKIYPIIASNDHRKNRDDGCGCAPIKLYLQKQGQCLLTSAVFDSVVTAFL